MLMRVKEGCWTLLGLPRRVLEKLCRELYITAIYTGRYGVKIVNPLMKNYRVHVLREFNAQPDEIFLGFDALKDEHTLCGVCIADSPHLGLMQALERGEDPLKTEYAQRFSQGRLDGRTAWRVKPGDAEDFRRHFEARKEEILNDTVPPVQVYRVDGRLYLADGKHRAALCTMLGREIRCMEISNDFLKDTYRMWIYAKMQRHRQFYKKNICLFEKTLDDRIPLAADKPVDTDTGAKV